MGRTRVPMKAAKDRKPSGGFQPVLGPLEKQFPFEFMEYIKRHLEAESDVQLAKALNISTMQVSKIRSGTTRVTSGTLLDIYDHTGLSIEELRTKLYKRPFTAPEVPKEPAYERFATVRKRYTTKAERLAKQDAERWQSVKPNSTD